MSESDTSSMDEEEFLHRQLCPDGACIGLLNSQGVCKECGMVGSSSTTDPRLRGLKKSDVETPPPEPSAVPKAAPLVAELSPDDELPEEFEDRRLCPDGSCIGVVGDDGVCGACGAVA
jgi:hypothetical protein